MRGRNLDGSWIEDWDAYAWDTRQYVEGSAWQYSWAVQQDPAGLIALHGGPKKLVAQLDKLMTLPPRFSVRGYPYEIHEMTEMAMIDGFGQYAHSNQPVHHVLYFYTSAGRPDRTQYWVRQVMERMYAATPTGLPGDEDNGEMSSWYVLNALGIFPLCPGHPSYVFGSPLVRRATVRVGGGRKLEIDARGNSAERVYVAGVKRNGARHDALWIDHETLAQGGTLTFTMSARPAQREYAAGDLPTTFMP
jgi:predicted alpha-1,2-mannosidase